MMRVSLKSSASVKRVQPISRSSAVAVCLLLLLFSAATVAGVADGVAHHEDSFDRKRNNSRLLWKGEVSLE